MFLKSTPFRGNVAQPKAADSIAVLPNGSCHLDGTTDIDDFLII